jgi:hypothetical protein
MSSSGCALGSSAPASSRERSEPVIALAKTVGFDVAC